MHEDAPDDLVHDAVCSRRCSPSTRSAARCSATSDTIEAMAATTSPASSPSTTGPANMVVAAAGDLDHDEVVAGVERRFAEPSPAREPRRERADRRPASRWSVVHRPTEQAHVVLGMARPRPRTTPTATPCAVANQVLGGGMSSRLFQEIREERGLAYSVYSYRVVLRRRRAARRLRRHRRPSRLHEVLDVIDDELDRAAGRRHHRRTSSHVAKGYLEGSIAARPRGPGGRMGRLGRASWSTARSLDVDEHRGRHPRGHHRRRRTGCCDRVLAGARRARRRRPVRRDDALV